MNEFEHYNEKTVYVDNDSMNLANARLLKTISFQCTIMLSLTAHDNVSSSENLWASVK